MRWPFCSSVWASAPETVTAHRAILNAHRALHHRKNERHVTRTGDDNAHFPTESELLSREFAERLVHAFAASGDLRAGCGRL